MKKTRRSVASSPGLSASVKLCFTLPDLAACVRTAESANGGLGPSEFGGAGVDLQLHICSGNSNKVGDLRA